MGHRSYEFPWKSPNKNPTKIPDVNHHKQSHGKSTIFIIGTPIKNGDFPWDFMVTHQLFPTLFIQKKGTSDGVPSPTSSLIVHHKSTTGSRNPTGEATQLHHFHPHLTMQVGLSRLNTTWMRIPWLLLSLDWFKGKFTGNHGFYHQIGWAFL